MTARLPPIAAAIAEIVAVEETRLRLLLQSLDATLHLVIELLSPPQYGAAY
ncbi:MAG: hypothetical protein HC910_08465 [Spirulinaceae cyanobacterium SM2_1_0]|nr:hypothetical protein [Spirulinaceae cyanobacterium SM2_1_0]